MVQTELMSLSKLELNKGQIEGLPANPREIANEMLDKLKKSIIECPEMLEYREILAYPHKGKLVIIGGNMRYRAMQELGIKEAPVKVLPASLSVDKLKEITLKDNIGYGKWDWDELANNWDDCPLTDWGMPVWENVPEADTSSNVAGDTESKEKEEHGKLTDKFIVPPFSVLDTRQGYWRERKEKWAQLIGDKGESRQNTLDSETGIMNNINSGVSILDPVMAELVCRWFGFDGAKAFDCFAGDTVFGYVSASLGMEFTGIELRDEQAALNNERVAGISAKYICDDGQNVRKHIKKASQDLFFSCPPYYDLEVYSDKPNDASNQPTYEAFIGILSNAFAGALECLKPNRFAVVVVGDVRDKAGFYYDFVGDIKRIFKAHGAPLYNECIIVEPIGTLPQRVGRYMRNRKIGKCHQNVLVFYKGDVKEIPNNYKEIEYASEDLEQFDVDKGNEPT